jgi:sugar/nucleoside kinase (ribokinase family)
MLDLIAVGELMLDVEAPALEPGRTIHAPVGLRAGGTPVNAALAAAGEGAAAGVVGRVGADAAGDVIRAALGAVGVEALLAEDPLLPTGTFLESGDAIIADRGANAAFVPSDIPPRLVARAVLVSAYTPDPTAHAAVERADAPWVAGPGGNVYIGNRPPKGGTYRLTCVTDGPDGATATLDGVTEHRAPPERVDGRATGAGDAFAAGLLLGLTRGLSLGDALELGCRLGLSVARTRSRAGTASAGS